MQPAAPGLNLIFSEARNDPIQETMNSDRKRRATAKPQVTHIIPNRGSIHGGQIITLSGWNLKSQNLNIGSKTDSSTKDEGDDYIIWFEMKGETPIFCTLDRHFSIIARHVGTHQSIFCKTPPVSRPGKYNVKMKIDGGETITAKTFTFEVCRFHS